MREVSYLLPPSAAPIVESWPGVSRAAQTERLNGWVLFRVQDGQVKQVRAVGGVPYCDEWVARLRAQEEGKVEPVFAPLRGERVNITGRDGEDVRPDAPLVVRWTTVETLRYERVTTAGALADLIACELRELEQRLEEGEHDLDNDLSGWEDYSDSALIGLDRDVDEIKELREES